MCLSHHDDDDDDNHNDRNDYKDGSDDDKDDKARWEVLSSHNDDVYIMMKCLSVCVSRKMITSSWEFTVTTCNHP